MKHWLLKTEPTSFSIQDLAATSAQRSKALAVVAGLGMLLVGAGGTPMLNGGTYWVVGPVLLVAMIWFVANGYPRRVFDGTIHAV